MGSVLAKLLDYGGFRDCGCAQGFPLKEEEEKLYLVVVAIFWNREKKKKHHRLEIDGFVIKNRK